MTPTTFLFTGQGSQKSGMCQNLYQNEDIFRSEIDAIAELMDEKLPIPLLDVLFKEEHADDLNQTGLTQPALFAIEYALAKFWQAQGISPQWVMGHSVGEFAAATFAHYFSLEDGIKLILARASLMQNLPSGGGMAAIAADEATLAPHLQDKRLDIAGLNSPKQTVVSGKSEDIEALCATLKEAGIRATPLVVSHAFHSYLMEDMLNAFHQVASTVTYLTPSDITLISNVTGEALREPLSADYWCQHVVAPVNFLKSIEETSKLGTQCYIEMGPHPVLTNLGMKCLGRDQHQWFYTCKGGISQDVQTLKAELLRS